MSSLPPPSPASPSVAPGPEPAVEHDAPTGTVVGTPVGTPVDLDRIAQDLIDVEVALDRLDQGSYWTCEVTGEPLPDDLLAADPVARRRPHADGSTARNSTAGASASPGSAAGTW
jgi:hypothetical protein